MFNEFIRKSSFTITRSSEQLWESSFVSFFFAETRYRSRRRYIFINRQLDNQEVVKGFSQACGLMAVVLNVTFKL